PVQWVNRPDLTFRGYAGTIAGGTIRPGDAVVSATTGREAHVARIVTMDGDQGEAGAGAAVKLTLDHEIDLSRGDMLALRSAAPQVADQLAAHVIWMAAEEMLPGRSYLLKAATRTVGATISELKHRVDIETFNQLAA